MLLPRFVTIDDPDNDEESEEDELEPRLKYEKLSADLKVILANDSASCIAVHPKLMALGTHRGRAHILDVMGNSIMPSGTDDLHTATVHTKTLTSCSRTRQPVALRRCQPDEH